MVLSNVLFKDFFEIEGLSSAKAFFVYKNKRYYTSVFYQNNNFDKSFKIGNIGSIDNKTNKAKINYDNQKLIKSELQKALNEFFKKCNAHMALVQGLPYNKLVDYYNEWIQSDTKLDLWDWMDSKGY